MSSPSVCIECGTATDERDVEGEAVRECPSCGSLRLSRPALNRLRTLPPSTNVLLAPGPEPTSKSERAPLVIHRCPVCRASVMTHKFGGGNVKVETCEPCDLVFLRRHALGEIVKEAHHGIEMSDDAKATLHEHRMLAAGEKLTAAELGLGTLGLGVLVLGLRIVGRVGISTATLVGAVVVSIGVFFYYRSKWQRQKAEAEQKMERLAAAEMFRLEQKERDLARSQDGEVVVAAPSAAPRSAARSSKPRACPMCGAKLPERTTHCTACDSDFG